MATTGTPTIVVDDEDLPVYTEKYPVYPEDEKPPVDVNTISAGEMRELVDADTVSVLRNR